MDTSSPVDPAAMRASDADRNQVAQLLGDALATGRLTLEEHDERLDAVYAARTFGDLEGLVQDLPLSESMRGSAAGTGAESGEEGARTKAVLSKIRRCGQWKVPRESTAISRFGAIVMDLRHATFTQAEVVLNATSFCGKIEVYVPENARVYDTGSALLGKRTLPSGAPTDTDGPVIHIRGRSVLGHIRVTRGAPTWHHHT